MFFTPQGRLARLPYFGWSMLFGLISLIVYGFLIAPDMMDFAKQFEGGTATAPPEFSAFSAKLIVPTLLFNYINFCLAAKRSRDFSGGINWALALFGIHAITLVTSGGNVLTPGNFAISALLGLVSLVIYLKLLFSRPRPADIEDADIAAFGESAGVQSAQNTGLGVAQYATDGDLRARAAQLREMDAANRPAPVATKSQTPARGPARGGFGNRTQAPAFSR